MPSAQSQPGVSPIQFPTSDVHTVQQWSRELEREVLSRTLYDKFVKTGVFLQKDELQKGDGDNVKFSLGMLLDGAGRSENEVLEGNEVAPTFYQDSLKINQLRQASTWYTRIDTQRVSIDFREFSKAGLTDWWADRLDTAWINQVCSNTVQTDVKYTGMNATIAPSNNNVAYYTKTTDADLDDVRALILRAKLLNSSTYNQTKVRPVMIDGGEYWPVLVHPIVLNDIRATTEWKDNYRYAMGGGLIEKNPIFTGAAGVVDGAILYESDRVPPACDWNIAALGGDAGDGTSEIANTRVMALVGKGAIASAFGRAGGRADRYLWNEESWDYGNKNGISASLIHGMKKTQFGASGATHETFDYGVVIGVNQAT